MDNCQHNKLNSQIQAWDWGFCGLFPSSTTVSLWQDLKLYDMMWYVTWCDMMWHDVIWYDMMWYVTWYDMNEHELFWKKFECSKIFGSKMIGMTYATTGISEVNTMPTRQNDLVVKKGQIHEKSDKLQNWSKDKFTGKSSYHYLHEKSSAAKINQFLTSTVLW